MNLALLTSARGDIDWHRSQERQHADAAMGGPGGLAGERPCGVPEGADYLIIDINYFPGFEKLPNYESMVVSFLHWLLAQRGASEKEREPVPGSPGDSSAQRLLPKFVSFSQTPSGRLPRQGSASSTGSAQAPPLLPSTPLAAQT